MKILISSCPKKYLRNDQLGDWSYTSETILASASEELPFKSQIAIAIHELIEALLCRENGTTDKQVCDFDEVFEKERQEGKHSEDAEPGDDERAPYRNEHMAATFVERAVCHALGISWSEHCGSVNES